MFKQSCRVNIMIHYFLQLVADNEIKQIKKNSKQLKNKFPGKYTGLYKY